MQLYSTSCRPEENFHFHSAYASCTFSAAVEINGDRRDLNFGPLTDQDANCQIRTAVLPGAEVTQLIRCLPNGVETSLRICNTGTESYHLGRLVLFHTEDLALQDLPSESWYFYRQGRMKNELPAVCRLGDTGDAFEDARATLQESGGAMEASDKTPLLVSDSLTVLSGGTDSLSNLMLTFETGDRLFSECRLSLSREHQFQSLECACIADMILEPGHTLSGEWLLVSAPTDPVRSIDLYARRKAQFYNARKGRRVPSVFCTWYYYGLTVSQADVTENLAALQRRKIPFDVFQVDEGWERCLGDWRPNEKFPSGMKQIAAWIQEADMTPGIWTSPFIAHENAPVTQHHPEWFLRHPDGSWCLFPMNDTVYRVLDITNPDAVCWAAQLYRQLREWGYRYHKLDFTRAAVLYPDAPRHDPTMPIVQAYRQAVQALRREMGEDAYFLMCGGLYDPLIGIVDAQRTGSDVLSMWSAKIGKGGGKTAPFTIKQNLLRYWMNPWWDADPDALMIRRQSEASRNLNLTLGLLNEAEVRTSALNQFMGGGLACSTEPMSSIEDDRLYVLRHLLPVLPGVPHPRDLFSGDRYPSLVDLDYGDYHMVCVINWSDTDAIPCTIRLDSPLLGDFADRCPEFTVCGFWEQSFYEHVASGSEITLGTIAPHGTALIKVLPQGAYPAVVTSTAHFSMGAELQKLEVQNQQLIFELDWKFPCPVRYGIRLPDGMHPGLLPENTCYFGSLLEIYIPRDGHYRIELPLISSDI